jgi:phosphoglycerate kinase
MKLKSIESMPDISGKKVIVRVDHNVTLNEDGTLKDDMKLRVSLPTLEFLIDRGAKITIMTHVGRPKGKVVEELKIAPIFDRLKELSPKMSDVTYLENVRFSPGEQENEESFIKELASHGEFFVNEAFPSMHTYEESSTCGVARLLPAYAGFYLQKEIEALSSITANPKRPLTLILSGAKIKTKIPVIKRFLDFADNILLGGCIANTFIAARGFDIGGSKYEEDYVELARELMLESEKENKANIHVPRDAVVATEPSENAEKLDLPVEDVGGDMKIFDIGKITIERYKKEIESSGTIVWNGPLGLYEFNRFSHASKRIAEAVVDATKKGSHSVIGGGDTLDFHSKYEKPMDDYSFVSTGGGAMIEFLSSEDPLPGLVPLMEK